MYNKGGLIPLIGLPKTQHLLNISLRPETMKQLEKKPSGLWGGQGHF